MRAWIALLLLLVGLVASVADRFPALPLVSQRPPVSSASTLNTSLISYWKLDEASGTRVDSEPTGTPQDLTDNNTVNQTNGVIGSAAWFISANAEYLSRGSSDVFVGDIDFSISIWVQLRDNTGNKYLLSNSSGGGGAANDTFAFDVTSGNFRFWVQTNGNYSIAVASTSITTNTWYHLVGWHDAAADTVNIKVNNGTTYSTSTSGRPPLNSTNTFIIGKYSPSGTAYWNGFVDEVGFWKKVLSASEISELYNSGAGKTCCPF